VTRDEIKFAKLVNRLRKQFSKLFDELLKTQLRLKKIIQTEQEWDYLSSNWEYKWATDNYYSEMSEASVWQQRFAMAGQAIPFVGSYFSNEWIKRKIFKLTDEEQEEILQQVALEIETGQISLAPPPGEGGSDDEQGGGSGGPPPG
jgi:hypothetical protein